jgi:hypothetical protein
MKINQVLVADALNSVLLVAGWENVLGNQVPGVTVVENDPVWTVNSDEVELEPKYNGLNCYIRSKNPSKTIDCVVTVTARISRTVTPRIYTDEVATANIKLAAATEAIGFGIFAAQGQNVTYKEIPQVVEPVSKH